MIFKDKFKVKLLGCLVFSILVLFMNYFMKKDLKLIAIFLILSNTYVLVSRTSYKIENNIIYINDSNKKKIKINEIRHITKSIMDLQIFFKRYRKGGYYIFYGSHKSIGINTDCKNDKNQTLVEYLVKEYNIKLKG